MGREGGVGNVCVCVCVCVWVGGGGGVDEWRGVGAGSIGIFRSTLDEGENVNVDF